VPRLSRSIDLDEGRNAGFTLIESLVALAVLAVALTAIGSLISANVRATRSLGQRMALVEATRAILTALPGRGDLVPGDTTGELADHRWRIDVMPFVGDFVDPSSAGPWFPEAVVLRVQSPTGEILRIDTVRLRSGQGNGQ
jgi:general secretion pathway protein I